MTGSPMRNQSMEDQQNLTRPIFINDQNLTQTNADLERDLDRDMNLEKENIPMNKEEETKLLIARSRLDPYDYKKNGVSDHMNMSFTEMLKLKQNERTQTFLQVLQQQEGGDPTQTREYQHFPKFEDMDQYTESNIANIVMELEKRDKFKKKMAEQEAKITEKDLD